MREHAAPIPEPIAPAHRRGHGASNRLGPVVSYTHRSSPAVLLALQRTVGNEAVVRFTDGSGPLAPTPARVLQRLALQEGPPLAPGNYRYGTEIVSLDQNALRTMLSGKVAREGLDAERTWEQSFAADMRAQSGKPRSYEDPSSNQTVAVEPMLATRADATQQQLDTQCAATQTQFQQQLLVSVGTVLDTSEKKLEAEGRRYGFPDTESIFQPRPVSAGQAAVQPEMPGSADLRGVMGGAKQLQAGKQKVKKARENIAKSGPILGDAMRPTVLEPALREYHELRQRVCTQYPILASVERDETRLAELASGAGAPEGGPAAAAALQKARDEVRKELADKLGNIGYIRDGMKAQDRIDRFWLDASLRANTKRSLNIAPASFSDAAVEEKVKRLQQDADFEQKLKQALGVGLLIASIIPGVGPVAGAVGLVVGAADVVSAFRQYYWEQAAAGTAMEKAEAISQDDPSLFGLAFSIAAGLLEGVAEAKALEGAIGVFKAVRTAYREARAAGVAAELGSGAAKASATAELVTATQKLRTTADAEAGRAGLGDKILADLGADARTTAKRLDASLKTIRDPALRELVRNGRKAVTPTGQTLMDLAIEDPHGLQDRYAEWSRTSRSDSECGPFEDWLRDLKQPKMRSEGTAGLDPTPETIKDGTVRMENHPHFQSTVEALKSRGVTLAEGPPPPHVMVRKIIKPDGTFIRNDIEIVYQKGMRYLDLEHEIGHVDQVLDKARFPDGPVPIEVKTQHADGTLSDAPSQVGVLRTWQDAIVEYHNRLQEIVRLSERGASTPVLEEHIGNLEKHAREYANRGIKATVSREGVRGPSRSPTQGEWQKQHFPDIETLEARVKQISTGLKPSAQKVSAGPGTGS